MAMAREKIIGLPKCEPRYVSEKVVPHILPSGEPIIVTDSKGELVDLKSYLESLGYKVHTINLES